MKTCIPPPNKNNPRHIEKLDFIQGYEIIDQIRYDKEMEMYFGYVESLGEGHWEYFTVESYWKSRTPLKHNLC